MSIRRTAGAGKGPLIQPSEDELRNGWTAETLTEYLRQQESAQGMRTDPHNTTMRGTARPASANNRYRPLRWRG